MAEDQHGLLAVELLDARRARGVVVPPSARSGPFELGDALRVLELLVASAVADGDVVAGLKVGLTYLPTWERVGVREPFVAPILRSGVGVGPVVFDEMTSPRLEAEVVVAVDAPLRPGCSFEDVLRAVGTVALGFEVVDSHYPEWKAAPADLVADFGCNAGARVGQAAVLATSDLERLDELEVALRCGGDVVAPGRGIDVLGHPLRSVAAALNSSCARPLEPGMLVFTGALTGRSHPIEPGQRWTVDVLSGPALPTLDVEIR